MTLPIILLPLQLLKRPANRYRFGCKIICGGFYGRKVWYSGTKYRSHIWRCNRKNDSGEPCSTPNIQEDMRI